MPKKRLTQIQLRRFLKYDRKTGLFTWKRKTARCINVGDLAGSKNGTGYIQIQLFGKTWSGHRLAWLYVKGVVPSSQIDHKNLIRSDNKFSNLRVATPSQNTMNSPKRINASSRLKGVSWHKSRGRWQASIKLNGRNLYLGLFESEAPAHAAYMAAAVKHFGKFARAA